MKYFVYIVECKDGSLYTGYTTNVKKRVIAHNTSKRGARSLRGKLPVNLVHYESYITKSEALKREIEIKSWKREKKIELIENALALRSEATNVRV